MLISSGRQVARLLRNSAVVHVIKSGGEAAVRAGDHRGALRIGPHLATPASSDQQRRSLIGVGYLRTAVVGAGDVEFEVVGFSSLHNPAFRTKLRNSRPFTSWAH